MKTNALSAPLGLAALLVAIGAAGCDHSSPAPPPQSQRGCATTGACPDGLDCLHGACVGGPPPTGTYLIRLTPATQTRVGAVEIADPIRFGAEPLLALEVPIVLPKATALTARMITAERQRIGGRLTARPTLGIAERPITFSTDATQTDEGPVFLISAPAAWPTLTGGRRTVSYRMRLVPEQLPPWDLPPIQFAVDERDLLGELPASTESAMVVVAGVVRINESTPVRGLEISAADGEGRRISTAGTTDETGRYSIMFWPDAQARDVIMRAQSLDPARPLPVLAVPASIPPGPGRVTADLDLGRLPPVFDLRGRIGEASAPVPGAVIRARAIFGSGTFSATTQSDPSGAFSLRIYPGDYVVDVEPPPDPQRELRLLRRAIRLDTDTGELLLVPGPRTQVFGRVVDPAGEPLRRAAVTSQLLIARYGDPTLERSGEAAPVRQVVAQTDDEGGFTLALDRGEHRLTISPETGRGLPSIHRTVIVPGLDPVVLESEIAIPPAAAIHFIVVDQAGEPVGGVSAEAWLDTSPPQRVATSVSDAQGRVTLALPNTEAPEREFSPSTAAAPAAAK